jgi:hypothetical protein
MSESRISRATRSQHGAERITQSFNSVVATSRVEATRGAEYAHDAASGVRKAIANIAKCAEMPASDPRVMKNSSSHQDI